MHPKTILQLRAQEPPELNNSRYLWVILGSGPLRVEREKTRFCTCRAKKDLGINSLFLS